MRGLGAILAGLIIGAIGGAAGVTRLEPGRPGQADSLQLMLDSLRQQKANANPREQRRAVDSADAEQRAQRIADSTALANDPDAPVIPDVVSLEEGAARNAIEAAGLSVGTVQFRAAPAAAGVVIAISPAAGRKARAGTAVNLVLSDGRSPPPDSIDTLAVPTAFTRKP
ncbi:MAG: PASTA domain-containing protein [Gemmatimonadaceae bacterium]|nr:PASTA domain-containing protein [Gemmatimonadaceae bacterium]